MSYVINTVFITPKLVHNNSERPNCYPFNTEDGTFATSVSPNVQIQRTLKL